jgi:glycosyltransferase involved in cell wall biosynthesis
VKIFLAGTSLLPSYGGPAYSVARLAAALADAGARVGLWTADQSVWRTPLLCVRSNFRRLIGRASEALAEFGSADVLHDNGIWLPHNHQLAVLAAQRHIPRIVSTRGMLEPWAFRHKRLKKWLSWQLYQRRDLQRAHLLHTTGFQEAKNLERFALGVPVRMIPNGVDLPGIEAENSAAARDAAQQTALFLGRIYPVKGLPMLIEAWAQIRPQNWRLQIAGPDEAGHRAEVERAVSVAGLRDTVSFVGPIEGEAKSSAYFNADLFILPSHSESFGMAVAEALAHGLPVLTTKGTPWSGLTVRGCGWCVDPTVEGIAQGLQEALTQDRAALRAMGAKGRAWVAADLTWDSVANRLLAAYDQLRACSRPPMDNLASRSAACIGMMPSQRDA